MDYFYNVYKYVKLIISFFFVEERINNYLRFVFCVEKYEKVFCSLYILVDGEGGKEGRR